MAGLAAELELLFLPLVVARSGGSGLLAGLDLLGQLDLLLGGEQVVFADGGEILADQVGGQTTTLVGQLARSRSRSRSRRALSAASGRDVSADAICGASEGWGTPGWNRFSPDSSTL